MGNLSVEQAKEFLQSKGYFFALWHIKDIKDICPSITDENATKVARRIEQNHDANEGINWLTISTTIESFDL